MIASMSALAAAWITLSGTMSRISSTGELGVASSGSGCCAAAPVMVAPTPGWIRLTNKRPAMIASRLERM